MYIQYVQQKKQKKTSQCTDGGDVCYVMRLHGRVYIALVEKRLHIHVTESVNYDVSNSADGYTVLLAIC